MLSSKHVIRQFESPGTKTRGDSYPLEGNSGMADARMEEARKKSLRLLEASSKSRYELFQKLKDKGFDRITILQTLGELEKQGVLNDREFARNLATRLTTLSPSGRKRIEFELKRKGIGEELRREVLESLDPDEEKERAKDLAARQWAKLKNLTNEKRRLRVLGLLTRRGFDYSIACQAIQSVDRKHEDADDENG